MVCTDSVSRTVAVLSFLTKIKNFRIHIRAYLKTGSMTNSEGFFRYASHFSAGILGVLQGKMVRHSGKRPAVWAF